MWTVRGYRRHEFAIAFRSRGARAESQELSALLLVAAQEVTLAHIEILIENEADLNARNNDGYYPLHLLLNWDCSRWVDHATDGRNRRASVLVLLAHGANVHAKAGQYGTALIAVSHHGLARTAKALILNWADLYHRHKGLGTAMKVAKKARNKKMIRLLRQAQNSQRPMSKRRVHYALGFPTVFAFGYGFFIICAVGFRCLCLQLGVAH